eukprot:356199-Chlamydomonas_euryale.AAC.1
MEWSGVEWSGVEWSGVEWSGVEWSGVEWSIVLCCRCSGVGLLSCRHYNKTTLQGCSVDTTNHSHNTTQLSMSLSSPDWIQATDPPSLPCPTVEHAAFLGDWKKSGNAG